MAYPTKRELSRLHSALGIVAIESRPGTLTADLGTANNGVTLSTGGGSPDPLTFGSQIMKPVTWANRGVKTIGVVAAFDYGEALVSV